MPQPQEALPDGFELLAKEALVLKIQLDPIATQLDACKTKLRDLAAGKLVECKIPGSGLVRVTRGKDSSESETVTVNLKRLEEAPELKAALVKKGVIVIEKKHVGGSKPSVCIEPNV